MGEEEPEAVRLQRHQGRHVGRRLRHRLGLAFGGDAASSRRVPTTPTTKAAWDKALADLKEFNKNVVITPGNAGTLDMLNRGEIAMGPVWVDMFYTWMADGKLPPNMRLKLVSPGMPGQPMYYAIPAKANAKLAEEFIALATSPEVQAEGIVKRFNWYPGIDAKNLEGKLDQAAWKKLFADISPEDLSTEGQAVPDRAVLQRHPRGLREEGRELIAEPLAGRGCRRGGRRGRPSPLPSRRLGLARGRPSLHGRGTDPRPSPLGLLLVAPALAHGRGAVPLSARLLARRRLHRRRRPADAAAFRQGLRALLRRHPLHALHRRRLDAPHRPDLDRDRRRADARRDALARRRPALALPLAAVHPVHRRGAVHAHVPRQERAHEQHASSRRPARAAADRRACSTGAASSSPSCGSRRRSSP